jgi:hypothetical protein
MSLTPWLGWTIVSVSCLQTLFPSVMGTSEVGFWRGSSVKKLIVLVVFIIKVKVSIACCTHFATLIPL